MFGFELYPVHEIAPWGPPDKRSLSWFALTYADLNAAVSVERPDPLTVLVGY